MLRRRLMGMSLLALGCAAVLVWLASERAHDSTSEQEERQRRRLFPLQASEETFEVRLVNPAGTFVLERVGTRWKLTAPLQTEADASAVQGLLDHAFGLEQKLLEEEVELPTVGLDPPLHTLEIIGRSGRSWRLAVGRRNSFDDTVYVRRGDAPAVGLAPAALIYQVAMDLFQLRERRVLPFDHRDIRAVRVVGPQGSWQLSRDGEDFWLGGDEGRAADPEQAQRVIRDLTSARVSSIVSDEVTPDALLAAGLTRGGVRVEVDGATTTEVLSFGAPDPDSPEQVLVHRTGTRTLASVPLSALHSLYGASEASLRDRRVIPFSRDAVYGIHLAAAAVEMRFERVPIVGRGEVGRDGWRLTTPESVPARDAEVFGLLYRLWTLRFDPDRMVSAAVVPSHAGLTPPRRVVELFDQEGEALVGFAVGNVELDGAWVLGADGRVGKVAPGRIEAISFALDVYKSDEE